MVEYLGVAALRVSDVKLLYWAGLPYRRQPVCVIHRPHIKLFPATAAETIRVLLLPQAGLHLCLTKLVGVFFKGFGR